MTAVIISLSMSRHKDSAESNVTSMLEALTDELSKMLSHAPSTTDKEWQDEISDKYISKIRRVANSVKTKKGHLSRSVLTDCFNHEFTPHAFESGVRAAFRLPEYKKMKKTKTYEDVLERLPWLCNTLQSRTPYLVTLTLENRVSNDDVIAGILCGAVREERAKLNGEKQ